MKAIFLIPICIIWFVVGYLSYNVLSVRNIQLDVTAKSGTNVKVGQIWFSADEPNPFTKPDTMFFKILEIKQGYAKEKIWLSEYGEGTSIIGARKLDRYKYKELLK